MKLVYLISSRGITQITWDSLLVYLAETYSFKEPAEAGELFNNFKWMDIGTTPIAIPKGVKFSFDHGELLTVDRDQTLLPALYYAIHPSFYREIMNDYIKADQEAH